MTQACNPSAWDVEAGNKASISYTESEACQGYHETLSQQMKSTKTKTKRPERTTEAEEEQSPNKCSQHLCHLTLSFMLKINFPFRMLSSTG